MHFSLTNFVEISLKPLYAAVAPNPIAFSSRKKKYASQKIKKDQQIIQSKKFKELDISNTKQIRQKELTLLCGN